MHYPRTRDEQRGLCLDQPVPALCLHLSKRCVFGSAQPARICLPQRRQQHHIIDTILHRFHGHRAHRENVVMPVLSSRVHGGSARLFCGHPLLLHRRLHPQVIVDAFAQPADEPFVLVLWAGLDFEELEVEHACQADLIECPEGVRVGADVPEDLFNGGILEDGLEGFAVLGGAGEGLRAESEEVRTCCEGARGR